MAQNNKKIGVIPAQAGIQAPRCAAGKVRVMDPSLRWDDAMLGFAFVAVIISFLFLYPVGQSYAQDEKIAAEAAKILQVQADDIILGDANAPVTLIEYASFSCSHCAEFQTDMLPVLKEKYITTGKLKLVFRSFTRNAQDIKATALVACVEGNEKKEKFISTLLKSIDKWAAHTDFQDKLKKIAKIGGLKEEKFDACMEDKKLEDKILKSRLDATNVLKVEATPTLFINGKKVTDRTPAGLTKQIYSLL